MAGYAFIANQKSEAINKLEQEYEDDCIEKLWDAPRPEANIPTNG